MLKLAAAFIALLPLAAQAQEVTKCDHRASAENIVEPWDQNSATYANGEIRVALLDTAEPAAAAFHLLIVAPPRDELGLRRCAVLSLDAMGQGFYSLDFAARQASYDPAEGLKLEIPAERFNPETAEGSPATLTVYINQNVVDIKAALVP